MMFFNKFRKAKNDNLAVNEITAFVSGKQIDIENVDDEVFSQKMMGDGLAIIPQDSEIVAPAPGVVTSVYPTGHAINLSLDSGIDVIIHIGIDTVELKGEGFSKKVIEGQKIDRGDLLIKLDQNLFTSEVDLTTMLLFPELKDKYLKKLVNKNEVIAGHSVIGKILDKKE